MEISQIVAIAGAHITCPHCHAAIGVLRSTLYQGWTFGLDAVRFESGQEPTDGQATCRVCGSSYAEIDLHSTPDGTVRTTLLHTARGWLPKPPPNAPAPARKPIRRVIR